MLAGIIRFVDQEASKELAGGGLQRCSWDCFDRELRALVSGDTKLSNTVAAVLADWGNLSEQDWTGLSWLGTTPRQKEAITAFGGFLRKNRQTPVSDLLSGGCKLLWPEVIQPGLTRALHRLALAPKKEDTKK